MKILKIYPKIDTPNRYNYHIAYDMWDKMVGDSVVLEDFDKNLNNYDIVFLPMFKRWKKNHELLNKIKNHKIKKVLFDNDSCYRSFNDEFYNNIDFIFFRDHDKNNETPPKEKSSWLPFSIDTTKYLPKYGMESISFNCAVGRLYPLRRKIRKIIDSTTYIKDDYINHLRNSGAGIHTDNELVPQVRAKALEFAACGCEIISNRTTKMDFYFPDELIIYFDSINELKNIIKNYTPNIENQKKLREIVVEKHDSGVRAKEIIKTLKEVI